MKYLLIFSGGSVSARPWQWSAACVLRPLQTMSTSAVSCLDIRMRRPCQLQAKVHTKILNHREGLYILGPPPG